MKGLIQSVVKRVTGRKPVLAARARRVYVLPEGTFRIGPDPHTEGERLETYAMNGVVLEPVELGPSTEAERFGWTYRFHLPRGGWLGIELRPAASPPAELDALGLLFRASAEPASLRLVLVAGDREWSWTHLDILTRTEWTWLEVPFGLFLTEGGEALRSEAITSARIEVNYFFGGGGPGQIDKVLTVDTLGLVRQAEAPQGEPV